MNGRNRGYAFGPYVLDAAEHCLWRDGEVVPLTPKVCDLLEVLVRNHGHLVEKDQLLESVWAGRFVDEANLSRNVSILRKALATDAAEHDYIETVPKRGYRFAAKVRVLPEVDAGTTAENVAGAPAARFSSGEPPGGGHSAARPFLRVGFILLALATVAGGWLGYSWLQESWADRLRSEIQSIAVLPLANLSGDPGQDYLGESMTEMLIGSLAQIEGLRVISRRTAMTYRETVRPLPEIAKELEVDAVLEGSVQRSGDRIRIMIQLIHGPTDTHLWASDFERALTDILHLQAEVARAVADEVRIKVTPEAHARMAAAGAVDPDALEQYLIGRYHLARFNEQDLKLAIEHFERAIELDPDHAPAHAGLAQAWWARGMWGAIAMAAAESPARAAAQRALELDNRLAESWVVLADVQRLFDWDWTNAENSFQRALELDPNSADAHHRYASLLMVLGRFPEALFHIETAARLDPLAPAIQSNFGRIYYRAGRFEEAIERLNRALELDSRHVGAYPRLADVYEQMGRYQEALTHYERACAGPSRRDCPARMARVVARMGDHDRARQMLADFEAEGNNWPLVHTAAVYTALGEIDEAFRLLFEAAENRASGAGFIKVDPPFNCLHADPRWPELLALLGLPRE